MNNASIYFVPVGGLGNRIRAIESTYRLCADIHAKMTIGWFQDWGMGCRFDQIFKPIPLVQVQEDSFIYRYILDRPRRKNLYIPSIYQHLHFNHCIYENICGYQDINYVKNCANKNTWMASCQAFYSGKEDYSLFQPIDTLQDKIYQITKNFPQKIEGIQIRRTDHVQAIQSSKRQYFEKIIDHTEVDTCFYLSTDSLDEKQYFVNKYKERIFTLDATLNRSSSNGIQDAMVDMYALAHTKIIHGSKNSSFGQIAAKIGNIPFHEVNELC